MRRIISHEQHPSGSICLDMSAMDKILEINGELSRRSF